MHKPSLTFHWDLAHRGCGVSSVAPPQVDTHDPSVLGSWIGSAWSASLGTCWLQTPLQGVPSLFACWWCHGFRGLSFTYIASLLLAFWGGDGNVTECTDPYGSVSCTLESGVSLHACLQHIQECQYPLFLPLDGELYVGRQLVWVCMEWLQEISCFHTDCYVICSEVCPSSWKGL